MNDDEKENRLESLFSFWSYFTLKMFSMFNVKAYCDTTWLGGHETSLPLHFDSSIKFFDYFILMSAILSISSIDFIDRYRNLTLSKAKQADKI